MLFSSVLQQQARAPGPGRALGQGCSVQDQACPGIRHARSHGVTRAAYAAEQACIASNSPKGQPATHLRMFMPKMPAIMAPSAAAKLPMLSISSSRPTS
jgi:hypothetical protein